MLDSCCLASLNLPQKDDVFLPQDDWSLLQRHISIKAIKHVNKTFIQEIDATSSHPKSNNMHV